MHISGTQNIMVDSLGHDARVQTSLFVFIDLEFHFWLAES